MGFARQEYWSGLPLPSPRTNYYHCCCNQVPLPCHRELVFDEHSFFSQHNSRIQILFQFPWTIKKDEPRRIDAFELWCWRRLLRVPWTARRSNQPILKEINPEYSLAGLILKLKLQYFGHLMQRTDSLEKTLMLGKIEGRRRG